MTQTTLYSDKKLFISLYKSALRRLKGMGLIYTLVSFITFPMFYLMEVAEAVRRLNQGYSYYGLEGYPEIYTPVAALLYFAVIIGGAVLISVYSNSFMHNKRAVDVFHALPVKRSQQLMANFCAVVTVLLSAQFLCYGIVAVVNVATVQESLGLIMLEALRVALLTIVIAAIAFFCSVCCNASLDSAVFSGAFLVIVPAYTLLIVMLMDEFVVGFYGNENVLLESVKFSPAAMMYQTFFHRDVTQGVMLNICYIVFSIAVMAWACRLYTKRKSEIAQSASTKSFLYQFIILATSTGGGVFFGMAHHTIFGYNYGAMWRLGITSCLFTVVIYLVFNAVMARNPRPTKRGMAGLAVSLAMVVTFLGFVNNGFFGFESYVPDTEDIESVTVNYTGDYSYVNEIYTNENSSAVYHRSRSYTTFTAPEEIDMVRDIHSAMVSYIGENEVEVFYKSLSFEYKLKNGQTVKRNYTDGTPVELIKKLVALEELESFKIQNYPVLKENVKNVKDFDIKDGFGNNVQLLNNLTEAQKEKLYNAMAQDTLNITRQMKDQRKGPVLARIGINYVTINNVVGNYTRGEEAETTVVSEASAVEIKQYTQYAYDRSNYDYEYTQLYTNVVFDVTQDCINTIRALEELGLGQYTTLTVPENLKAVVFAAYHPLDYNYNKPYWATNWNFEQYEIIDNLRYEETLRIREYTETDQINQLVSSSQTSLYAPSQKNTFYVVAFVDKDVEWRETEVAAYNAMCYYISSNNAPEFVKSDLSDYADGSIYFSSYTAIG